MRTAVVYDGEDRIVPSTVRELGNQIHCYYLEWECIWGHWDAV